MSSSHHERRALLQQRLEQMRLLEQLHLKQAQHASRCWHMQQQRFYGSLPDAGQVALEVEEQSLQEETRLLSERIADLRATLDLPLPLLRLPDLPALNAWVGNVSDAELEQVGAFYEYIWKIEWRVQQIHTTIANYVPFVDVPVHLLVQAYVLELKSLDLREQLGTHFAKLHATTLVDHTER